MQPTSFRNVKFIAGIIACLLLAAIPAVTAGDGTNATSSGSGTIIVMSFPQGASIYLNDAYHGTAPKKLENIPAGSYLVNVSMAGYNNDSVPVELFNGSTREIGFTLESASSVPGTPVPTRTASPGYGSIAVDSSPGGAVVILDGVSVGTTRTDGYALILNSIPSGNHSITVEQTGYSGYSGTVTVVKNQVVKVNAVLGKAGPASPGAPVTATGSPKAVPVSLLTAVAAVCIAGLAAGFYRS